MSTPQPISLSDTQMDAVIRASAPLEHHARSAFLEELADALRDRSEIGEGFLHQVIREIQRKYIAHLRTHASWHQ